MDEKIKEMVIDMTSIMLTFGDHHFDYRTPKPSSETVALLRERAGSKRIAKQQKRLKP